MFGFWKEMDFDPGDAWTARHCSAAEEGGNAGCYSLPKMAGTPGRPFSLAILLGQGMQMKVS